MKKGGPVPQFIRGRAGDLSSGSVFVCRVGQQVRFTNDLNGTILNRHEVSRRIAYVAVTHGVQFLDFNEGPFDDGSFLESDDYYIDIISARTAS